MSDLNKEKVSIIISKLSEGLYEKEEVIALTFLCALAGKSVFLYGLPGTAKSLIVRRVASAFKDSKYFGQLMNRFTTPEDVFGPVSLSKLKEDKFERQVDGYLPKADFVFLDEIWKSSPAILNTLLTIVNEKVYRNGTQEEKVPLKALIAASNETPPKGQGLEAMYDRFIMRLLVNPVESVDHFKALIMDKDVDFDADLSEEDKICTQEWEELKHSAEKVKVSDNVFNIIMGIKTGIEEYNQGNHEAIYVSDRRWKNIISILKTAAYFSDRDEVLPVDCFLISHCIWTLEENINEVKSIVENAIKNFSQISRQEFKELSKEVDRLKKDISIECVYDQNVYTTVNINGKKCIPVNINYGQRYGNLVRGVDLYIPIDQLHSPDDFFALDSNGNDCEYFKFCFNCSEILICKRNLSYIVGGNYIVGSNNERVEKISLKLPIIYEKGTFKTIDSRTRDNYMHACDELVEAIDEAIKKSEDDLNKQKEKIDSPFVAKSYRDTILDDYINYIAEFKAKRIELEQEKEEVSRCPTYLL